MLEDGKIISNLRYKGDYFKVVFDAPRISQACQPGQFVHVRIEALRDRILRRPFSINDAVDGQVKILYKIVGEGTKFLSTLGAGTSCNMMGPSGNGFKSKADKIPLIVTGGYGAAATFMLAKKSPQKGILIAGAKTKDELVLIEEYEKIGFKTLISTDDGSRGEKAFVTKLLDEFILKNKTDIAKFAIYACGPRPMLDATIKIILDNGLDGEISLDHLMCCGVGACLACVVKLKNKSGGWKYSRTCTEGPVFMASDIFLDCQVLI